MNKKKRMVTNQEFWSATNIIETQDTHHTLHWYENYLLELIKKNKMNKVEKIHIVGCGTGREIPGVRKRFPGAEIIASDISDKMIERCKRNLIKWKISEKITLINCEASELSLIHNNSDIIIEFNSILTYVLPLKNRIVMMKHLNNLLKYFQ